MAPSLLSLSEKLIVRITNFVDYPSLPPLALVSRTLNRLATPQIYASIDFEGGNSCEGVTYLIPLTSHLLQNPDLASLVRSFSIRDDFGSDKKYLEPLKSPEAEVTQDDRKGWPFHPNLDFIIRKAVEDVEDKEEEKGNLFEGIRAGSDEGAILTILLPKFTNLRKLDLAHSCLGAGSHLLRLLHKVTKREAPFDEKPALANLTDVLIAGYDDKYPNAPDLLGACLELPSIRRLYGYHMGNNDQDSITTSMVELGTGTSPVEELELRGSKLYAADLDRVLKACGNLKTFIYEVGHAWAWYLMRTQDIRRAMEPLERTLENLVLDHPDYLEEQLDDDFSPVSLMKFDKLRYLKISGMFLGGTSRYKECNLTETFPVGLEKLHVTYVGEEYHCAATISALQQVMERKEHLLPRLEKLILEGSFVKYPARLDGVKGLVQTAKTKGVEIVILTIEDRDSRKWGERTERGWGLDESVQWQECIHNQVGEVAVLDVVGFGW